MNLDWSEDNLTNVIFNGATPEHRFTGTKAEARALARIWLVAAAPCDRRRDHNLGDKLAEMSKLRTLIRDINEAMDGRVWDGDTLDAIAAILAEAGYALKKPSA